MHKADQVLRTEQMSKKHNLAITFVPCDLQDWLGTQTDRIQLVS